MADDTMATGFPLAAVAEPGAQGDAGAFIRNALGLALLFGLAVGCAIVLRPFFVAILWSAILAVSTWPLYCRILRFARGRRSMAALLMTLLLATVLLLPLVLLGTQLTDNVLRLIAAIRAASQHGLPPPPAWIEEVPLVGRWLAEAWQAMAHNAESFNATVQSYIGPVRAWLLARGADLAEGLLQVSLSLLTVFFFYRDGPALLRAVDRIISKITGSPARRFTQSAGATVKAVVLGLLGTSLVLGILSAAAYWAAGVPGALFLGFLSFFLNLLPGGMGLIWLPAAIWLVSQGATQWAVFIVVWGLFLGALDNILRPYLMRQGSDLPFLLILIGVVGGALGFGLIGVFVGPTLLGIAFGLAMEWGADPAPAGEAPVVPIAKSAIVST
jgi:predicted PurR-regulated permease PerM